MDGLEFIEEKEKEYEFHVLLKIRLKVLSHDPPDRNLSVSNLPILMFRTWLEQTALPP